MHDAPRTRPRPGQHDTTVYVGQRHSWRSRCQPGGGSGNGCTLCRVDRCGDGIVNNNGQETCNDGNTVSNDGCSSTCRVERCGDGIRQTKEACDDGNIAAGDGCDPICRVERCGDGIVNNNGQQTCDDGNTNDNEWCASAARAHRRAGAATACGRRTRRVTTETA